MSTNRVPDGLNVLSTMDNRIEKASAADLDGSSITNHDVHRDGVGAWYICLPNGFPLENAGHNPLEFATRDAASRHLVVLWRAANARETGSWT